MVSYTDTKCKVCPTTIDELESLAWAPGIAIAAHNPIRTARDRRPFKVPLWNLFYKESCVVKLTIEPASDHVIGPEVLHIELWTPSKRRCKTEILGRMRLFRPRHPARWNFEVAFHTATRVVAVADRRHFGPSFQTAPTEQTIIVDWLTIIIKPIVPGFLLNIDMIRLVLTLVRITMGLRRCSLNMFSAADSKRRSTKALTLYHDGINRDTHQIPCDEVVSPPESLKHT